MSESKESMGSKGSKQRRLWLKRRWPAMYSEQCPVTQMLTRMSEDELDKWLEHSPSKLIQRALV